MSILANLLKKTETSQTKAEIPPGVLQAVSGSNLTTDRRNYYLVGGLSVAAIAIGVLLGLYLNNRPAPSRLPVAQPQTVPQPLAVVQQPVSSAVQAVVADQQAGATAQQVAVNSSVQKEAARPATARTRVAQRSASTVQAPALPPVSERKVVQRDRSIIDAHLFAARNAEARRDYLMALRQYQQALDADPENYRIMNNVASTMLQLGMYEEALGVANRALSVKPDYVSAMVNAGIAHSSLGHVTAARGMFSRAVILDPGNRSALYNLALSQERSNSLDEAMKTYRRLADGGDPQGYLGQGRLYERQGRKDEALRLYRELTALPDGGQRPKDLARERIKLLEE